MKVRICTDKSEVIASVFITKRDIEERTWAKHTKVELRKEKNEGSFECYVWRSENHNENDVVINYEYVNGFVAASDPKSRELIKKLMEDREWVETVEKLKRFVDRYLEQVLKQ